MDKKLTTISFSNYQITFFLLLGLVLCPYFGGAQTFFKIKVPDLQTNGDSRSVNFLDVNNDGWEDVFISNGLKGGQPDQFFLNDGTGGLIVLEDTGIIKASNPSDGASFADYNNDGFVDGVVSSWYGTADLLYLNDGQGRLVLQSNAGLVDGSFAETAAFGDYDQDGWLDLYITNSGTDKHNFLYRNLKNGHFEQITDHILVGDAKLSRGAVWLDVNNDGISDLFVANEDNTPNDLFIGKGKGAFEKRTGSSIADKQLSSITASWGDIDNDGDFDLFVGNSAYFAGQVNQLFRNTGMGFEEVRDDPVVREAGCSYGSAFGDFDNDGDLDLLVANGFCHTGLSNSLFENQGDGSFKEVSGLLSSNEEVCSFGAAWGDLNNDGFLDLVIANCKNKPEEPEPANTFLLNAGNNNHWLAVKLKGSRPNTSAIGARVRVKATIAGKEVWQTREITSQSGYAGQNSLVAHFGLGDATLADSLLIRWPSGEKQILEKVTADQRLLIEE